MLDSQPLDIQERRAHVGGAKPNDVNGHFSTSNSSNTKQDNIELPDSDQGSEFPFAFTSGDSSFRSALENRTWEYVKKGKRRGTIPSVKSWNLLGPLHESPQEEKGGFDFEAGVENREGRPDSREPDKSNTASNRREMSAPLPLPPRRPRSFSVPHVSKERIAGNAKWGRLRSLLQVPVRSHVRATSGPSQVAALTVNITDELITGGLSALMLRLWFERDEKGHRRIPVLLHHLRIRVSDSLHPLHGHKTVFRIECEYANGAARWVIYRQLRDFVSLHTHYTLSNTFNRNVDKLPEFPRTSLPYFNFLRRETRQQGRQMGKIQFARIQRAALEDYLINLIRAVIFHPSSNRLAGFFEISALSIALAQSGGAQYKAGFLWIEAVGNNGVGFGRKSATWRERKQSRWCAVRESYLVVLEAPGELAIWDVFLIDTDFKIERPKRYYRQRLNFFHSECHKESLEPGGNQKMPGPSYHNDSLSLMGTIRHGLSKVFKGYHHDGAREKGNGPTSISHTHDEGHNSSSGSSYSAPSRPPTPILDPSTNTNPLLGGDQHLSELEVGVVNIKANDQKKKRAGDVSKHTFYIENSQMRLKLFARNERQMLQWIAALEKVAATSYYTGKNRFDSFVPIRLNVAAQWLVDGRDYFWNLSRAILLARETIFIHDWWLSPELQLRRPNKAKYRLDRMLEKKAKEGVKIYVIVYQEVSNWTTPTDSNYTKQKLAALHKNIMVQRSPSHFQTGTFYWAHHEKLCVIDQSIAFMGGIDLCFGRWDTPQHVLVDDPDSDAEQPKIWPGKDYSNPRISDFHTLNKPEEDMYDRTKVPRMPWHDVGMQVVGQPARDLARHFIQRWNFLLRIKNHTQVMPFLLPPPEFKPAELTKLGLSGTCEMQICRSAGPWSLGTPSRIEHSIQNAYLKAIQMSEHFVYIENQFFITSTVVNDVKVVNKIGDALVHRIIRARRENTPWKCCIVIPVMPGFAFPVDHSDASALRIIMELQNCTISRGPSSIFGRLRKEGIDPDDYISVFSLRNWAKLRGDILTTEQIYIHGKTLIVDDRLVIIGSANINERSQRGDRDSEIAAVIRDTDMVDCTMAGKPFKVGRFAHSLRVRLMREHIGVDVDALSKSDLIADEPLKPELVPQPWVPNSEQETERVEGVTRIQPKHKTPVIMPVGDQALQERQTYDLDAEKEFGSTLTIEEKIIAEQRLLYDTQANKTPIAKEDIHITDIATHESKGPVPNGIVEARITDEQPYGAPVNIPGSDGHHPFHDSAVVRDAEKQENNTQESRSIIRKYLTSKLGNNVWTVDIPPRVDPQALEDPISDEFWTNVWVASAVHNTEIYRKVFHAIPDDSITTWKQYREFVEHHERLNRPATDLPTTEPIAKVHDSIGDVLGLSQRPSNLPSLADNVRSPKPFEKWEREEMEKLLGTLCGHLVVYPNRFLEAEDIGNNFLFNADRLLPMPIYD